MEILVRINPQHRRMATGEPLKVIPDARDRTPLSFGLEIPHFLAIQNGTADLILPSDQSLASGDLLIDEYGRSVMVMDDIQRRKARGNWSGNPFDENPDWVRVRYF